MKPLLHLLCGLFSCVVLTASAQFPQTNPVWHYNFGDGLNGQGYSEFTITGDSLIDGHTASEILVRGQFRYTTAPGTSYVGPLMVLDTLYMYSSNDSVYIYREDAFHLAFRTSGQPGDIWDLGPFAEAQDADDDHAYLRIDSVGQHELNGVSYNLLHVSRCDAAGTSIVENQPDSLDYYVNYHGTIHEAFGPVHGMNVLKEVYPTGSIIEFYPNNLLCYESDETGFQSFSLVYNCTANIFLGIDELLSSKLQIYPNPSDGKINVRAEGTDITGIEVMDNSGRIVYRSFTVEPEGTISLEELLPGIYTLVCHTGSGTAVKSFVRR